MCDKIVLETFRAFEEYFSYYDWRSKISKKQHFGADARELARAILRGVQEIFRYVAASSDEFVRELFQHNRAIIAHLDLTAPQAIRLWELAFGWRKERFIAGFMKILRGVQFAKNKKAKKIRMMSFETNFRREFLGKV